MIDEKKLIEDIKAWSETMEIEWTSDNVISLLESAPKIVGWISYKDKLPNARNNILICQKDGYVSIGYYSQGQFLDLNSVEFDDVIAWQPLPEAYHGQMD